MAAESPISLLKRLFLSFFSKMVRPDGNSRKYENRFSGGVDRKAYESALNEWKKYTKNSKATVLKLAATVTSLVDVIGQAGVDEFNTWIATYAGGTGAVTTDGLKALQDWYNKYLKPLS